MLFEISCFFLGVGLFLAKFEGCVCLCGFLLFLSRGMHGQGLELGGCKEYYCALITYQRN
jgi:hypothetical protein